MGTTRRRLLRYAALAAAGAATLSGASALSGCDTHANADVDKRDGELLVGACLELSGVNAVIGTAQERGLRLAVEKLNETGVRVGRRTLAVRLLVRDNAGDPARAVTLVGDLITGEKVSAIIGSGTAAPSIAMAPVCEDNRTPMIALGDAEDVIQPIPQKRFIYQVGVPARLVADVRARQMAARKGDRVVLLAVADPHGDAGAARLPAAMQAAKLDRPVATVRFAPGAAGLTTAVSRVLQSTPDAVVV